VVKVLYRGNKKDTPVPGYFPPNLLLFPGQGESGHFLLSLWTSRHFLLSPLSLSLWTSREDRFGSRKLHPRAEAHQGAAR
jgi:hypothetical protein